MSSHFNRAQSEVIGVILLTAVIVIVTVLAGGMILGSLDAQDEPSANLKVSINDSHVTIGHHGGTDLDDSETSVILITDDSQSIGLSEFDERQGDGDDTFESGELVTHGHGASDTIRVLVVHDSSGTLLYDRSFDVPDN